MCSIHVLVSFPLIIRNQVDTHMEGNSKSMYYVLNTMFSTMFSTLAIDTCQMSRDKSWKMVLEYLKGSHIQPTYFRQQKNK